MTRRPKKGPDASEDTAVPPAGIEFAERLVAARKNAKMTQVQLAEASGINQSHISKLERGEWEPRLFTIMSLAAALDVSPANLIPSIRKKHGT